MFVFVSSNVSLFLSLSNLFLLFQHIPWYIFRDLSWVWYVTDLASIGFTIHSWFHNTSSWPLALHLHQTHLTYDYLDLWGQSKWLGTSKVIIGQRSCGVAPICGNWRCYWIHLIVEQRCGGLANKRNVVTRRTDGPRYGNLHCRTWTLCRYLEIIPRAW